METRESEDGDDEHAYDHHRHDGHDAGRGGEVSAVVEHVDEAEDEDGRHVEREGDEEHEEVAVVAPPDAVVHPGAVVVENLREETTGVTRRTGVGVIILITSMQQLQTEQWEHLGGR